MSSVERNNPPPRRKSCDACRTAKRRCDLALPTCFRCTRRGIACVYPGLPPDQIPELLALLSEQPPDTSVDQLTFDSPLEGESFLEPLSTDWAPQNDPIPVINDNRSVVHVRSINHSMDEIIASRFQYAMDVLQNTPRMMVTENQTPWSHSQLYSSGMPKAMQDAYACCALYITKNPINAPMITSHIHTRHQELILSPLPSSPSDLLAYTHALLLYTIMHLFDADLHALNTATSLDTLSISTLQSSASLLFGTTHFPPPPDPTSQQAVLTPPTPHFWTLWLTSESARRTILFSFYLIQIMRFLRGDKNMTCDGKLGLLHSWYSSAYLWNASSDIEFASAWVEREHFVVRNVDFGELLQKAMPGDVDSFGRMLLVTSLGVGRVREWFGGKGAIL